MSRDKELEKLEGARHAISSGIQVSDIVGEPGIGKSRLLHAFLGQIEKHPARVLIGYCTSDGQQTPFQAFIEIARGAFGLAATHNEAEVSRSRDLPKKAAQVKMLGEGGVHIARINYDLGVAGCDEKEAG